MAPQSDERSLHDLEEEIRQCIDHEEFLECLDIYEVIQSKGWITASHMLGMGHCLLKVRRKQDARDAWIRAHQMDSAFDPVIKALDGNFPGWRKLVRLAEAAKAQSAAAAPVAVVQPMRAKPTTQAPPPIPKAAYAEAAINWSYVLEDVSEARSAAEHDEIKKAADD